MLESLADAPVARLEGVAAARQTSAQALARDILREWLGVTERQRWGTEIRALRERVAADPQLDTIALIRAEREARTARILGEDDAEAWAATYRAAL